MKFGNMYHLEPLPNFQWLLMITQVVEERPLIFVALSKEGLVAHEASLPPLGFL